MKDSVKQEQNQKNLGSAERENVRPKAKLNTNSNAYIIIYSAVLVVVVAFLLAFVFQALKPLQDANVALDVKKQILYSLNIRGLDGQEAEQKYAEVVKRELDADGQKAYRCDVDGEDILVVSLKGMGLWGGISGYVAVKDDGTVYGAYFNHESETAGLGAEIKDSQEWQEKFIGKRIYGDDGSVVLSVVKKVDDPTSQVDCVTGATLTSNGVDAMLKEGLRGVYELANEVFLWHPEGDCDEECCGGEDGKGCCAEGAEGGCCSSEESETKAEEE